MPRLTVLVIAVGLVLLIACGNAAGLLLAQGSARRSELAIPAALGASRAHMVRQLLAESVVLSLISGAAGVALAFWLRPLLLLVTGLGDAGASPNGLESPVLLFALALSLLTGILFGILPALRASSLQLSDDLAPGGRATASKSSMTLRGALVVGRQLWRLPRTATGIPVRRYLQDRHCRIRGDRPFPLRQG